MAKHHPSKALFPKLKERKRTEAEIVKSIQTLLKFLDIWHWKVFTGPHNMPGVSDILGIYQGKFLAIEVKRPDQVLTDLQESFLNQIKERGGIAFVATCCEDVITALGLWNKFKEVSK